MHRNMFIPTLFNDKLVVDVVINDHQQMRSCGQVSCTCLIWSCKIGFIKRYENYEITSSRESEKCKPAMMTCLNFAITTESRAHLWSLGGTSTFWLCPPPRSVFATLGAKNWALAVVMSFHISPFKPGSGVIYPIVPTLHSFKSQPGRLVTKIPEGCVS